MYLSLGHQMTHIMWVGVTWGDMPYANMDLRRRFISSTASRSVPHFHLHWRRSRRPRPRPSWGRFGSPSRRRRRKPRNLETIGSCVNYNLFNYRKRALFNLPQIQHERCSRGVFLIPSSSVSSSSGGLSSSSAAAVAASDPLLLLRRRSY